MKTLIIKLLAVMAIVFVAVGTTLVLAVYYSTMWQVLASVTTLAIVFYAVYRSIKWIFAEELEENK